MKSLREVYEEIGVSRTTLQGWLNDILDWPKQERRDNAALKISDEDFSLIWQIRFYKQLKYSSSKIKEILHDPSFNAAESLELQIDGMKRQKEELEELIQAAIVMKETCADASSLKLGEGDLPDVTCKNIAALFQIASDKIFHNHDFTTSNWGRIPKENANLMTEAFEYVVKRCYGYKSLEDSIVQLQIQNLHRAASGATTESILVLSWILVYFAPGSSISEIIDRTYGEGCASYFYRAMQHYCKKNQDNKLDKDFYASWSNIEVLAHNQYPADSAAVQAEILKLQDFFTKLEDSLGLSALQILKTIGKFFGKKEFKEVFDTGNEKGVAWFMSRAIAVYCYQHE